MKTLQVDFPFYRMQPAIKLEYASGVPDGDAQWLASHLKEASRSGQKFRRGETLQIGSMLTKFLDSGDRRLVLGEPDMQSMPMHFEPGVSRTLTVLRLQKDAADSIGLVPRLEFSPITASALACTDVDSDNFSLMYRADTVSPGDSGWFVACGNRAHDHNLPENLLRISIYELMVRIPAAAPFLALPVSSAVVFDGRRPAGFWCDDQRLTVREGSLLQQMALRAEG